MAVVVAGGQAEEVPGDLGARVLVTHGQRQFGFLVGGVGEQGGEMGLQCLSIRAGQLRQAGADQVFLLPARGFSEGRVGERQSQLGIDTADQLALALDDVLVATFGPGHA